MKDYISHIQSPLSNDDYSLFMKAVSTEGSEATAYLWVRQRRFKKMQKEFTN
nr:MAG TPA: hypothetical protein [Caudoviricetes sp.]